MPQCNMSTNPAEKHYFLLRFPAGVQLKIPQKAFRPGLLEPAIPPTQRIKHQQGNYGNEEGLDQTEGKPQI